MIIPKLYALYACVIMLLIDLSLATQRLVPSVVQAIHQSAARHTRSLARDLRVAFGGVLAARADTGTSRHVIYCKPGKQVTFRGGPGGSPGNSNSTLSSTLSSASRTSGRPTSTSTSSKPTSTTPASSPWKLVESHVN